MQYIFGNYFYIPENNRYMMCGMMPLILTEWVGYEVPTNCHFWTQLTIKRLLMTQGSYLQNNASGLGQIQFTDTFFALFQLHCNTRWSDFLYQNITVQKLSMITSCHIQRNIYYNDQINKLPFAAQCIVRSLNVSPIASRFSIQARRSLIYLDQALA